MPVRICSACSPVLKFWPSPHNSGAINFRGTIKGLNVHVDFQYNKKKKRRICRRYRVLRSWKARLQAKRLHQMFAVWSVDSADQRAGRRDGRFRQGGGKQTKKILDPPFCWSSKTREQMGHTQKHRHYCFLRYPPEEESWTVTTVNIHCRSVFVQMLLFCHRRHLQRGTRAFLNLKKKKKKWLMEKINASANVLGIYCAGYSLVFPV